MNKKIVPIVFAADDNYAFYLYVELYSLIKVANPDYQYEVYVFATRLARDNQDLLESLSEEHVKIQCIDISDIIADVDLRGSLHLSIETYYRLFIPIILPQYKKVIYLDTDMVILHDVAEFFEYELDGHALGAIQDVFCTYLEIHSKNIGLDCRKAFNAGVLLIDTVAFEEQGIRAKCLELLSEDYEREQRKLLYADQDALNCVLYDNFKVLDDRWNFQWQYLWRLENVFEEYRNRYQASAEKPYILHYAGEKKPWAYPELPMADVFWKLAKQTAVYEDIVFKNIIDNRVEKEKYKCFLWHVFPYDVIPAGSKIAIYAAGEVGKAFYNQMALSHYAKVVLWVDRNYSDIQTEHTVESPEMLIKKLDEYQYVVVAVDDEGVALNIIDDLKKMGVPEEKIKWKWYRDI